MGNEVMKKALMNASVASMIYKFNMNNIEILEELGYQVDVACNFGKENPISQEQIDGFKNILKEKHIKCFDTSCPRDIFAVGKICKAYKQLKKIAYEGNYDLVHTQSPIGGVICRLAFRKARKKGTKVIYQAHGFHFYKGAPLINWLVFYPIEKICSRFTDILITINREDYKLAQDKFGAKKVEYVPGIGLDISKFKSDETKRQLKRQELRLGDNDMVLFSVGELNENKNHGVVIRALAQLRKEISLNHVKYLICGQGELKEKLKLLIEELGLKDNVRLMGFRTDVKEIFDAVDLFVFPSHREGLPVALMEAMASGKTVICSNIRGNVDLIDERKGGFFFESKDVESVVKALKKVVNSDFVSIGHYNREKIKDFDSAKVKNIIKEIYEAVI